MIKDLAGRILELFKNGKGLSKSEIDNPSLELTELVSMILGECKCSTIDEQGNYIRYGSSLDIKIVEKIILSLLCDENIIMGDIIKTVLAKEDIDGPNVDLKFRKNYNSQNQITELQIFPIMSNDFDEQLGKKDYVIEYKLMNKILQPYVKELIYSNEILMKRSPVGAIVSKTLHRTKSIERLKQKYYLVLKKHIKGQSKIQIRNSVNYIIDNILENDAFKTELINKTVKITELEILGKTYTGFTGLVYNMIGIAITMIDKVQSPNKEYIKIEEIYYTIIAVLIGLSNDLTTMNANEIQEIIKKINSIFTINSNNMNVYNSKYRERNIDKDLYGNELKYIDIRDIGKAMDEFYKTVKTIVTNKDAYTDEQFIKEAMRINYRYIRIMPFKIANGRTIRTLVNMILQTKKMGVCLQKGNSLQYINSILEAHRMMQKNEIQYMYNLVNNPEGCYQYEQEYLKKKVPLLIVKE